MSQRNTNNEMLQLEIEMEALGAIGEQAIATAKQIHDNPATTIEQHERTNELLEMIETYLAERLREIFAKAVEMGMNVPPPEF